MAARQASSNSLKSIAGALLLALGLAFLFGNLEGIAACINNFAGISAHDAGAVPGALREELAGEAASAPAVAVLEAHATIERALRDLLSSADVPLSPSEQDY